MLTKHSLMKPPDAQKESLADEYHWMLEGKFENENFLPPDTHTYVCVSGGKKYSFFGKFGVLCFLVSSVLRIALLPNGYHWMLVGTARKDRSAR